MPLMYEVVNMGDKILFTSLALFCKEKKKGVFSYLAMMNRPQYFIRVYL